MYHNGRIPLGLNEIPVPYKRQDVPLKMRLALFLTLICIAIIESSVVVSVQSASHEEMLKLTEKIDQQTYDAASYQNTNTRTVLGAIEATMSRVEQTDAIFTYENIRSVPVMNRISDMEWLNSTQEWRVVYQSMINDPQEISNQFSRTIYFTRKNGNFSSGDTTNPMLTGSRTREERLDQLKTDYIVLSDTVDNEIQILTTNVSNSLLQTINITIPHVYLIQNLATKGIQLYPGETGNFTTWSFGIGMSFESSGASERNIVMFDLFHLYDKSSEFMVINAETQYSIADSVEFYGVHVSDKDIKIGIFHFTVDSKYSLLDLTSFLNGSQPSPEECEAMNTEIDLLPEKTCLISFGLCLTQDKVVGSSRVVSIALPLTSNATTANLVIRLQEDGQAELVTSLNFQLTHSTAVCKDDIIQFHDAMQAVHVDIYTTPDLLHENIANNNVHSLTLTHTSSIASQAIMTLIIGPSSDSDVNYFDSTPSSLQLDSVFMTHALGGVVLPNPPDSIESTDTGKTHIVMPVSDECPNEKADSSITNCVTTEDWYGTIMTRPKTGSATNYFVHEVHSDHRESDTVFVDRIFGSEIIGDIASASAGAYLQNIYNKRINQYQKMYVMWPVYNWETSPVGLIDRVQISFSWSLLADVQRRRLLSMADERHSTRFEPLAMNHHYTPTLKKIHPNCLYCTNTTHKHEYRQHLPLPTIRRSIKNALHKPIHHTHLNRRTPDISRRDPLPQ